MDGCSTIGVWVRNLHGLLISHVGRCHGRRGLRHYEPPWVTPHHPRLPLDSAHNALLQPVGKQLQHRSAKDQQLPQQRQYHHHCHQKWPPVASWGRRGWWRWSKIGFPGIYSQHLAFQARIHYFIGHFRRATHRGKARSVYLCSKREAAMIISSLCCLLVS